jgi:hypothetical protein
MDDDLRSLRSGSQPNDDDLFGAFSDPDDLGFDSPLPPPATAPGPNDFSFDNEFSFPEFDDPALTKPSATPNAIGQDVPSHTPTPTQTTKTKPKASPRLKPRARGMTPQQRMILAVFLFLDVAILGFLILLVIGAIQI